MLVYVDGIILIGNDINVIYDTTTMLHNAFKIKNIGDLTYFLGFEVAKNSKGIHLSKRKYTLDMLHETGMLESSSVSTPVNFSTKLTIEGEQLENPAHYRKLICKLIY